MTTQQTFKRKKAGIEIGAVCTLLDLKRFAVAVGSHIESSCNYDETDRAEGLRIVRNFLVGVGALPGDGGWMPGAAALKVLVDMVIKSANEGWKRAEADAMLGVMLPMLTQMPDVLLANVKADMRACCLQIGEGVTESTIPADAPPGAFKALRVEAPAGLRFDENGRLLP